LPGYFETLTRKNAAGKLTHSLAARKEFETMRNETPMNSLIFFHSILHAILLISRRDKAFITNGPGSQKSFVSRAETNNSFLAMLPPLCKLSYF
jgi:hypothetical protein